MGTYHHVLLYLNYLSLKKLQILLNFRKNGGETISSLETTVTAGDIKKCWYRDVILCYICLVLGQGCYLLYRSQL